MPVQIYLNDLGIKAYKPTWDFQKELFSSIIEQKKNKELTKNTLIFVEHPHVYTLGKHGDINNLLITREFMNKIGAEFYEIDRGGDITYHGPGQLVVYPIFDLENFNIRTREFVFLLEKSIIELLKEFNITASRKEGAAGVWLDSELPTARKICSIGIKSSRGATMHGIALNINTNLDYFTYINPCGFKNNGMTSIQKEKNQFIDIDKVKKLFLDKIAAVFNAKIMLPVEK